MTGVFILLIAFQAKHYLADYLLQGRYMLGKFDASWGFVLPLAAHCQVHAVFTLGVALAVRPGLWWLFMVDFAVHFLTDRAKAGPRWLGRWTPSERPYWLVLGLDQMTHHLTHYWIIWMLVRS